jgi:hypothetical protein
MTVEALTDRDGKQANTSLKKEEMVRHESFPPNDGDLYYELPPVGSSHTHVTEQAVERPYCHSQSRQHRDQTHCLLALYGCSGSWTKRGS